MASDNEFIICLMGPTASGKTGTAVRLAKMLPCEIVSVDSALIYRGMDIGTAKPSMAERDGIVHHLIDILDPREVYSAADFRADALRLIHEIQERGNIPLLVGGTMLYFNALLAGISDLPQSDPAVRKQLKERIAQDGLQAVHRWLAAMDPEAAERIKPNDEQRIMRALEVKLISGATMTELTRTSRARPFGQTALQFALMPEDRQRLRLRIGERFDRMMTDGFVEEVRTLYGRGDLAEDMPSMRAVGYRQCWQYLDGRMDRQEMVYRAKVATCQLAKRQITWLRGWKFPYASLDPEAPGNEDAIFRAVRAYRQDAGAQA
ncbi:MAG: tRNA (adenosine(37)-N6)-dimethylallyltransferase MiaA [Succinivibrionaceae bacterium]|nr:tRNA (adenosine(37)-N6)-dimethylallyltransferase MiaA [Succinivibrionaceae bacterium]